MIMKKSPTTEDRTNAAFRSPIHIKTMKATNMYSPIQIPVQRAGTKWMRIALLTVLAYEGLGGIAGGVLLTLEPDGRLMDMPVDIMNGAFSDYFIPGLILLGLGILNCMAFVPVLRRWKSGWVYANLAMGGYVIWFITEIIILQNVHWLHAMWGLPVVLGMACAAAMIPRRTQKA
jgi:hypothetical protein